MNKEKIMNYVQRPVGDAVNVEVNGQMFTHMAHLRATDLSEKWLD